MRARITLFADRPVGKVNRWVFGNNMLGYQKGGWPHAEPDYHDRGAGVWDPELRRPVPEMVALAKNVGLSVARYPGGCGVHLFDWKRTVGPVAQRPEQQFGLPEFLQLCEAMGAVPLITLADYYGSAQDAADLVEYLNAFADARHPWAQLRARDGRRRAWNVRWFEYGNESEHGDHVSRRMSPREYAENYLQYRRAMRSVDPNIRLGAVIATGFPDLNEWARPVLQIVGKEVDFVVHHSYIPQYSREDGIPPAEDLFALALAAPDQIQAFYDDLRRLLREVTGRDNIPIAVTEFNGHFVQEKPVPYRHTLGNALLNAEMLRVFLKPQNRILMANFWQFSNEYWGMVKGYVHRGEQLVKRPQYYSFEMYHHYFGDELLEVEVESPRFEVDGGYAVAPARGRGQHGRPIGLPVQPEGTWQIQPVAGVEQRLEGEALAVEFRGGEDINYYHARLVLPAKPNTLYRLSGWVRTEGLTSSRGACFQIGDARGWLTTRSAAITPEVTDTSGWTRVEIEYRTLPDTREVEVLARRLEGGGAVRGRAWYRGVQIQQWLPRVFPAVPYLSAVASRRGKRLYVMLVNKHLSLPMRVEVQTQGFSPRSATMHTLHGERVDSTNEQNPTAVSVVRRAVGNVRRSFLVVLPAHSLTALQIDGG
ncbi:MAG: alpha-L-arabinofuranosidase C-terminal domain-containing protein [Armatimonadota bacterium]|nr:alpha-L-arabinofuranosidase C-terminal domain-containing protein [Armatimonadota bacterium]